jgi:glycosyltransferase involved in cell wall biosynthesis
MTNAPEALDMEDYPLVSLVIPVWNSPDLIAKCLAAIGEQTYPCDRFEVLVIDNGSTDTTADVIRSFPIAKLISEPAAGSYCARNRGLGEARGEYVAFTDADCVPDPTWLSEAVKAAHRHPTAGVLAGRVELFRAGPGGSEACEKYESLFSGFNQARNVAKGFCITANWMSRRELLERFGGFNATLKSSADSEFARRIGAAGHPIVYVPDMVVKHPARGRLGEQATKCRRVIGGRWQKKLGSRRFLQWIGVLSRESARTMKALLTTSQLSVADRLKVGGVVMALWMVSLIEVIRLRCGGDPRRA